MKLMSTTLYVLLLTQVIFSQADANYIGVENNFRHIGQIQTDDRGDTNFFEFSPGVIFATSIPFTQSLWFYPGASLFFPQSSDDGLYSTWKGELNFHLLYPFTEKVDFIFGSTYLATLIVGSGGTSVQGNGESSSTYYVPEESKLIGGFAPEVGIRYEFWRAKYIYLGAIVHQILDTDAQSFTVSLSFMTWI